ncbi:hypothetical protein [Bacillus sp. AFS017336]|uniref:hypothetical protein n=1 Tax=Bacillus sp. AFS017336 TaxID=2033489 RepID=UPI000BF15756|nr:hypothetical protein [Bacillus sp. AFS017336]PEL08195.1 hypothetical protein CN601_18205 [Bacillus sp. AFS017336]
MSRQQKIGGLNFKKQKENGTLKEELEKFKPTHLKFNFSFITSNNNYSFKNQKFTLVHKAQLMDRIYALSDEEYTIIANRPKSIGFEFIPIKTTVKYNEAFDQSGFRKRASHKYMVIRLYPNCNPLPSRIIGKMVDKIFYVLYIDMNHSLYKG